MRQVATCAGGEEDGETADCAEGPPMDTWVIGRGSRVADVVDCAWVEGGAETADYAEGPPMDAWVFGIDSRVADVVDCAWVGGGETAEYADGHMGDRKRQPRSG